jgi:hypothetical protein
LNQTGTYTILFTDAFSTGTGGYSLALERLIPPSYTVGLIQYGETINGEINPVGDMDLFFFYGTEGDTIVAQGTYQSGSMRPCIELVAPDNTRTKACANSFSNRIDTTLNQTGTYTILFTDAFSTGTGGYTLTLQCLNGACVTVPTPDVAGCIEVEGQPLVGAPVTIRQSNRASQRTTTDANGEYQFENVPSGSFRIIIRGVK